MIEGNCSHVITLSSSVVAQLDTHPTVVNWYLKSPTPLTRLGRGPIFREICHDQRYHLHDRKVQQQARGARLVQQALQTVEYPR
jgi:hypothetical protein